MYLTAETFLPIGASPDLT